MLGESTWNKDSFKKKEQTLGLGVSNGKSSDRKEMREVGGVEI